MSDELKTRIIESLSEAAMDACKAVKTSARGRLVVGRGSTQTSDAWKIINVLLERAAVTEDEQAKPMAPDELAAARQRLIAARKQSA